MKYKLKTINALFLDTNTEPETPERAMEILQLMKPILDSQKKFWKKRIEELFEEFVDGTEEPEVLMNREKDGLHWEFHKKVFKGMCEGYLN